MNWFGYIIGTAIILLFILSVVSLVKSIVALVRKRKNKNVTNPDVDVNGCDDNSNKEV